MNSIKKVALATNILSKYFNTYSDCDVSSFEDESQIVINLDERVSDSDYEDLVNLGCSYNEDLELWFI